MTQRLVNQFITSASPEEQKIREKMALNQRFDTMLKLMVEDYHKEYGKVMNVLSQMNIGTRFKETNNSQRMQNALLGKPNLLPEQEVGLQRVFVYDGPCVPFKPTTLASMIMEEAKAPYKTINEPVVLYHLEMPGADVTAYHTIIMSDFVTNFILGEWQLVDAVIVQDADDVAEEKNVLRPVPGSMELIKGIRGGK